MAELTLAQQIRRQVFVEEQGISALLEYDEADATAIHVLAYLRWLKKFAHSSFIRTYATVVHVPG